MAMFYLFNIMKQAGTFARTRAGSWGLDGSG